MKRSEFPEKAYEALFIHELLKYFSEEGTTPFYVPSQVKEKGFGYDLCFVDNSGNPINRKVLLIQFKTSLQYEGAKDKGFFKFEIYKGRDPFHQHNKLCSFNTYGSQIAGLYCAPRFVAYEELYRKVLNSEVISDSVFFKPTVPLLSGHHYVKFSSRTAIQCSSEQNIYDVLRIKNVIESLKPISLDEFKEICFLERKRLINTFDYSEDDSEPTETNNPSSYFLFL